ncbi:MAG: YceI family protein [Alphaproteobacteria bacterium]
MTKAIPFVLAFFAALSAFAPVRAEPAKYVIDPEHFSIAMSVRHAGYFDLVGLFTEGAGSFVFDEAKPEVSDIRVTIKTASFFSGHKKRDEHVRSADFLNAKEFPEMVFVGKSSEKTGDRTGRIHGELTLRGVIRPLTLDIAWVKSAEYPMGGGLFGGKPYVTGINARAALKRSDFGMTYAVENGLVGDDVVLMLGFEARRQTP